MNSGIMEEEPQKHPLNHSTCVEEEAETPTPPSTSTWFDMELPLGTIASSSATETFRLEKAVCSHGLFMMAPNHWDPLSNVLTRPLRLHNDDEPSSSLIVSVSQRPTSLNVRVRGAQSLSSPQERALLSQVSRMLRLSENEEKAVREFRSMSVDHQNRSFGGRVFRSPTLFEDMVKCVLLCNCQWPRTLSMAQALCELQLELQNGSPCAVAASGNPKVETEGFIPKTPAAKETQRKRKRKNSSDVSTKGTSLMKKLELEVDGDVQIEHVLASSSDATLFQTDIDGNACQAPKESSDGSSLHLSNGKEYFDYTGNFPSPSELANLDESFLAKRCKLGYRAGRIIELARAIVDGKLKLKELEELSKDASLSSYKLLEDQLKQIKGFGPFTCANVLMCMGYYHVIPTDSETVRHLKQVHSRKSTTQTNMSDVEEIYGKFKPYQFLAYWSEIWDFYERRFGKMNEMHSSHYKLITASNMRSNGKDTNKRKRSSERNIDGARKEIGPREQLVHEGGNNPKAWKVYIRKRTRATPITDVADVGIIGKIFYTSI